MVEFTDIPITDLDPLSPVTQPLMTALRDNPISIAEGDVTAPCVRYRADWQVIQTITTDGVNGGWGPFSIPSWVTAIRMECDLIRTVSTTSSYNPILYRVFTNITGQLSGAQYYNDVSGSWGLLSGGVRNDRIGYGLVCEMRRSIDGRTWAGTCVFARGTSAGYTAPFDVYNGPRALRIPNGEYITQISLATAYICVAGGTLRLSVR